MSELPVRIAWVEIHKLFGHFSYRLPDRQGEQLQDIAILYGSNGSGKTTILSLVFHILSGANNRGHRHAIAEVPFGRVKVALTNGLEVTAQRTGRCEPGAYDYLLTLHGEELASAQFDPNQPQKWPSREDSEHVLDLLQKHSVSTYMLSDDREIRGDLLEDSYSMQEWYLLHGERRPRRALIRDDMLEMHLKRTIDLATGWLRKKALSYGSAGVGNANMMLLEVVRAIASAPDKPTDVPVEEIVAVLNQLEERSAAFAKFQFSPPFPVRQLIQCLEGAQGKSKETIIPVLQSYVRAATARLDAQQEILEITKVFVESFNAFYSGKSVEFGMVDGLRVRPAWDTSTQLPPKALSSGERQLMILFCYALVSRESPSVFIVDEPELSLNVKWQRGLIRALHKIVEGSGNQFLFATHSVELLSQHQDSVVELSSAAGAANSSQGAR